MISSPIVVPSYLNKLNPEQLDAVLHGEGDVGGPLLIIAGAGSGKTARWPTVPRTCW